MQSFRFAAADGASPAFRPRAISWVMVGGLFSGVLGPQLVTWTMGIWPPYLFAASYLAQAVVALVAMAVLAGVDLPRPGAGRCRRRDARLARSRASPRFMVAVLCGVVTYTLMNLVMTSAPLAMRMCGLPISASNATIQWHVVAMYAPSFFTGTLIARFGAQRVVAAGLLLLGRGGGSRVVRDHASRISRLAWSCSGSAGISASSAHRRWSWRRTVRKSGPGCSRSTTS